MDNVQLPKDRYMKYPLTLTAKVAMFPYKYHYKHTWFLRYWLMGLGITGVIFWKITNAVNSPANVAKWAEIRRKMYSGEHS